MNLTIKISDELKKQVDERIKEESISLNEFITELIEKELNSKIELDKGFYYNTYIDKLFNEKNKEVKLTKIEHSIVRTLLNRANVVVSVNELIKSSWSDRKEVSIFTFRNMIKNIRDKTYYGLIKSHSSKGYSLNI